MKIQNLTLTETVCVYMYFYVGAVWPLKANANSSNYNETSPVLISYLRTNSGSVSGGSLCLIASLKSHKAVLTLTGCQSITARPLLMGGNL